MSVQFMNGLLVTCPFFNQNRNLVFVAICFALCLLAVAANAQIEGFTEPFRKAEIATEESGPISSMGVIEGQFIEEQSVICELDSSLQKIQVELARHRAEAKGQVWTAEQSWKQRKVINRRIKKLVESGSATESELLRSEMELSIAQGKMLVAREEAASRDIEYRQSLLRLDRRTIRAPFSGIVSKVHIREGEFVSTLQPEIVTLMQVDKLLAKFNVPSSQVDLFSPGSAFELTLGTGQKVTATVYRVAVSTDAQSGTVEIKMLIENPELRLRAGEILTLNI